MMENTLNNSNSNNSNPNIVADPNELAKDIQNSQVVEVPEDLDIKWLRWKCLICGYVHEGSVELRVCPKCGNEDPDKFDDAE